VLNVRAIDTYYGESQVLFEVSLRVDAGEIVALLGPSGAGKTTTLRSILGLTPARTGAVEWQGLDVTRWATHRIARLGIKWVPDDRRVFPTLSAARNLSIARRASPFPAYSIEACCEIFPRAAQSAPAGV
jgi:branched-chain amino acid transport system ATP-binding protein